MRKKITIVLESCQGAKAVGSNNNPTLSVSSCYGNMALNAACFEKL
jgi:hypothetical protein